MFSWGFVVVGCFFFFLLGIDRNQGFQQTLRVLNFVDRDSYTSKKTKSSLFSFEREGGGWGERGRGKEGVENKGGTTALWQTLSPQCFCSVVFVDNITG